MLPKEKTKPKTDLKDLTILIYGPGKIGKSTWASHADGALFLATEPGLNALEVYQSPISNWEEMLVACSEVAAGDHNFKTIIIDTIDNAYRMCADYICKKNRVEHETDLAYGKGSALVNNEFNRVLTKLAFLPYGLFLISHSTEKEIETRTGKFTKTTPTLPDKARKIVLGMADMILFCDVEQSLDENNKPIIRRVMRTKPNPNYEAGDKFDILPEVIPLDYHEFLRNFNKFKEKIAKEENTKTNLTKGA